VAWLRFRLSFGIVAVVWCVGRGCVEVVLKTRDVSQIFGSCEGLSINFLAGTALAGCTCARVAFESFKLNSVLSHQLRIT
jgi:hypothetical protein